MSSDASVQCQFDSFVSATPQHGVYDSELSDVNEDLDTYPKKKVLRYHC